jgi:MerT mercuric transport protein
MQSIPTRPPSKQRVDCACRDARRPAGLSSVGGILGAVGICAACCLGPLVFAIIGITSAWIRNLDILAPYKRSLIAATVVMLGYGFFQAYRPRARCTDPNCTNLTGVRVSLWIGLFIASAGLMLAQAPSLLMALR